MEIEATKLRVGDLLQENLSKSYLTNEESPMNSYLARTQNGRLQGHSTPSPRSRTSCTEESPRFARGAKEFTPSSKGKNSGIEHGRNELTGAHVISFGEGCTNLFRSNNLQNHQNNKYDASSLSNISGNSLKLSGGRDVQEIDNSKIPGYMSSQLFSFQQVMSPKDKDPHRPIMVSGEYHTDTIIEMEDDARSSKDEVHRQIKCNSPHSSQKYLDGSDVDEEEYDDFIQNIQKGSTESHSKHQFARKSSEKRIEGVLNKASLNSNGSYVDSRDYGSKQYSSMMPHYNELLKKGKVISLKQSPGTLKTDAKTSTSTNKLSNRNFDNIQVPNFKLDDLGSKKYSSKEDSLPGKFEMETTMVVNRILQNQISKESSCSLAKSSKNRDFISSQLESELSNLRSKEIPYAPMAKQGSDLMKGVMSMDSRANGRHVPYSKAFEKKIQSTGLPDVCDAEHKNEKLNWIHDPMIDPENFLKGGIKALNISRSPLRSGFQHDRDRIEQPFSNRIVPGSQKEALVSSRGRSGKEELKPASQNPTISNSYLDKFQRKNQPIDGRGTIECMRKSQLGPFRGKENDKIAAKIPIPENNFDKFMNGSKKQPITPRAKQTPKANPLSGYNANPPSQDYMPQTKGQVHSSQIRKTHNSFKEMAETPLQPHVQQHPQPEKIVRPIPMLENIMSKQAAQKRVESPKLRRKRTNDQPLHDLTNTVENYPERSNPEALYSSRTGLQRPTDIYHSGNYPGLSKGISNDELRKQKQRQEAYQPDDQAYISQPYPQGTHHNGTSGHQPLSNLQRQTSSRDFVRRGGQPPVSGKLNIRIDIPDLTGKTIAEYANHTNY